QLPDRAGDVFDWDIRVDPVLVEQVDHLGVESAQRCVRHLLEVLGPAVKAVLLAVGVDVESELCSDHHLVTHRPQRLADQLLIYERAVHLGSVEEAHPAVDRGPDKTDHLAAVTGSSKTTAHTHAAKSDSRNL